MPVPGYAIQDLQTSDAREAMLGYSKWWPPQGTKTQDLSKYYLREVISTRNSNVALFSLLSSLFPLPSSLFSCKVPRQQTLVQQTSPSTAQGEYRTHHQIPEKAWRGNQPREAATGHGHRIGAKLSPPSEQAKKPLRASKQRSIF